MTTESMPPFEKERKAEYKIMFTRHAERLASGELSEIGQENAKSKGRLLKNTAEVFKNYSSNHSKKRAYDTAELIASEAEIISPQTQEIYKTRERPDFQYEDTLAPDLYQHIGLAKDFIEEATLKEAGMSTDRDEKGKLKINIEKLTGDEGKRIAPIRQRNQGLGYEYILSQKEVVHRMAVAFAHRINETLGLIQRYDQTRKNAQKPIEKDAVINNSGHGLFAECLFLESGVFVDEEGRRHTGFNLGEDKFGGYLQPLESFYLEIKDPENIPDLIPIIFENEKRPSGKIFIKKSILEKLEEDYIELRSGK